VKILVIIGGISKDSINKKLFELIKSLAPKNFEFDIYDISLLPFYSQGIESEPSESVLKFKEKVVACEGVLFITPEYNRSIPGVLKMLLIGALVLMDLDCGIESLLQF
jgi:chromate reductase